MSIYFLSPQAAQDLQAINDYLFASNPDSADRFLTVITQKFETLAKFPNMGRRRDELSSSLRSFPVDDYLIFYRQIEGGIEIRDFQKIKSALNRMIIVFKGRSSESLLLPPPSCSKFDLYSSFGMSKSVYTIN